MSKIKEVKAKVEAGKVKLVPNLVQEALNEGTAAGNILAEMIDAMSIVGDKFSTGEIFVPEMLVAAKAMQKGVEVLKPALASAGFEVIDLGVDVKPDKFIEAIKENPDVKVVACSALLTTTMPALKEAVEAIKASELTGFKVIVGGAPITQEFAKEINADAYAQDAGSAAVTAKSLI